MVEPSVCAIVVTFNPDSKLPELVQALASQVGLVIVVDNASSQKTVSLVHNLKTIQNLELIENPSNLGLGAGFNIGLRRGLELGYSYLGIFDQDSSYSDGLISELLSIHTALLDESIAVVSPIYRDENLGFTVHPDTVSQTKPLLNGRAVEVMSTFSSASLIRADALRKIGLMNEGFFIDYIDHEFCLRCHSAGYHVLQATNTILEPRLGNPFKTWLGIIILIHDSNRLYYQYRNRVILYKQFALRFPGFIFRDWLSSLARLFEIIVYQDTKIVNLLAIFEGFFDGMQNKSGIRMRIAKKSIARLK